MPLKRMKLQYIESMEKSSVDVASVVNKKCIGYRKT